MEEVFQPKSFSKVYAEFHIDKARSVQGWLIQHRVNQILLLTLVFLCRRIGAGGFGKVYLIARRLDGRLYAAKYQKLRDRRTQRMVSSSSSC